MKNEVGAHYHHMKIQLSPSNSFKQEIQQETILKKQQEGRRCTVNCFNKKTKEE